MMPTHTIRRVAFLAVVALAVLLGVSCTPSSSGGARPVVVDAEPKAAKRGDVVEFRATATNNPTAFNWVFWPEGSTPWTNRSTARADAAQRAFVTLTGSGLFTVVVTAQNEAGTSDPFAFQVNVADEACGVFFADPQLPHATTGIPYEFRFVALSTVGLDTSRATFRVVSGALPDGMTLSEDGYLRGTTPAALPRTFTVAATVGACRVEQSFTLTVQGGVDCSAFAFQAADKDVTVDRYVPFEMHVGPDVTGGAVSHVEVADGVLPLGLNVFDPDFVRGTPESTGISNVTLRALRADGKCSATGRYRFIVRFPITISPAVLPAGSVGVAYDQALTVPEAAPPHTFIVQSGALPPGLSLAGGHISGVPTAAGSYSVTLRATVQSGTVTTDELRQLVIAGASDAGVDAADGATADAGASALMTMSGTGVGLTVSGGVVYATAKGEDSLWSVSTTGANPHKVATYANPPTGTLTYLGGDLYTVAYSQATGTGGLYKASAGAAGTAATAIVSGKPYPNAATANRYGVASDGTALYFTDDDDPGLHRSTTAGATTNYSVTGASIAHIVAANATHVYYTESSFAHAIRRTDVGFTVTPKTILSGSNMATLVGRPLAMTLFNGLVYVVGQSNSVTGITPGVGELDTPNVTYTSGSLATLTGGGPPSSIAVDASGVYVGVAQGLNPGAGVYKFALSGTAPPAVLVASASAGVAAVAVDATYVYYLSGASVYRVAK